MTEFIKKIKLESLNSKMNENIYIDEIDLNGLKILNKNDRTNLININTNFDITNIENKTINSPKINNSEIAINNYKTVLNNNYILTEERLYPPISIRENIKSGDANKELDMTGHLYGNGIYYIERSSSYSTNHDPILLFNNNSNDSGHWAGNYTINETIYNGTFNNYNGKLDSINYRGDWVIIKLPVEINLSRYKFTPRESYADGFRCPGGFRIYGSNNDIDWNIVVEKIENNSLTSVDYPGTEGYTGIIIDNNKFYKNYLLIVDKLANGGSYLNFGEWYIYGMEKVYLKDINNNENNLVAHYKFNGNLIDEIGESTMTLYEGSIKYNSGAIVNSNSIELNGNKYTIESSNLVNLLEKDDWTITFWVYISSIDETQSMGIIARYDNGGSPRGGFNISYYARTDNPSGVIRFERLYNTSSWSTNLSNFSFRNNLNKWIHVSVVCYDKGSKIYINGILDNEVKITSSWVHTTDFTGTINENKIGFGGYFKENGHASNYDGYGNYDDLRFYNKSLSDIEIKNLYNSYFIEKLVINKNNNEKYLTFKYNPYNYKFIFIDDKEPPETWADAEKWAYSIDASIPKETELKNYLLSLDNYPLDIDMWVPVYHDDGYTKDFMQVGSSVWTPWILSFRDNNHDAGNGAGIFADEPASNSDVSYLGYRWVVKRQIEWREVSISPYGLKEAIEWGNNINYVKNDKTYTSYIPKVSEFQNWLANSGQTKFPLTESKWTFVREDNENGYCLLQVGNTNEYPNPHPFSGYRNMEISISGETGNAEEWSGFHIRMVSELNNTKIEDIVANWANNSINNLTEYKNYGISIFGSNITYQLNTYTSQDGVWNGAEAIGWIKIVLPNSHNYIKVEYTNNDSAIGTGTTKLYIDQNLETAPVLVSLRKTESTIYEGYYKTGDILKIEEDYATIKNLKITISNNVQQSNYKINFSEDTECDILVVGGGGGGGSGEGEGGYGGEVILKKNLILNGEYDINVGNGGYGNKYYKKNLEKEIYYYEQKYVGTDSWQLNDLGSTNNNYKVVDVVLDTGETRSSSTKRNIKGILYPAGTYRVIWFQGYMPSNHTDTSTLYECTYNTILNRWEKNIDSIPLTRAIGCVKGWQSWHHQGSVFHPNIPEFYFTLKKETAIVLHTVGTLGWNNKYGDWNNSIDENIYNIYFKHQYSNSPTYRETEDYRGYIGYQGDAWQKIILMKVSDNENLSTSYGTDGNDTSFGDIIAKGGKGGLGIKEITIRNNNIITENPGININLKKNNEIYGKKGENGLKGTDILYDDVIFHAPNSGEATLTWRTGTSHGWDARFTGDRDLSLSPSINNVLENIIFSVNNINGIIIKWKASFNASDIHFKYRMTSSSQWLEKDSSTSWQYTSLPYNSEFLFQSGGGVGHEVYILQNNREGGGLKTYYYEQKRVGENSWQLNDLGSSDLDYTVVDVRLHAATTNVDDTYYRDVKGLLLPPGKYKVVWYNSTLPDNVQSQSTLYKCSYNYSLNRWEKNLEDIPLIRSPGIMGDWHNRYNESINLPDIEDFNFTLDKETAIIFHTLGTTGWNNTYGDWNNSREQFIYNTYFKQQYADRGYPNSLTDWWAYRGWQSGHTNKVKIIKIEDYNELEVNKINGNGGIAGNNPNDRTLSNINGNNGSPGMVIVKYNKTNINKINENNIEKNYKYPLIPNITSIENDSLEKEYPPPGKRDFVPTNDSDLSYTKFINHTYGSGYYTIKVSNYNTTHGGYNPIETFNEADGVAGLWQYNQYTTETLTYIDSNFNDNLGKFSSLGYKGDWIYIKLPVYINLTKFKFKQRAYAPLAKYAPGDFKIYGSNDETNWTVLVSSLISPINYLNWVYESSVSTTGEYQYFLLIVNKLVGPVEYTDNLNNLNFDEWYIYGKEYNFDTNKNLIAHYKFNNDLNDSSGLGNNLSIFSTGNGATQMSYVDGLFNKAISFNNTGIYTSSREYLRIGNIVLHNIKTLRQTNGITFSIWFYPTFPSDNSTEDYHCIFDTDGGGKFYIRQYDETYKIELAINNNRYFTTNTFQNNKWNNIVIVLHSGSTFNIDLILNGDTTTHSNISDTIFGTTSDYNINNGYIGIRHNGSSIKTEETWDGYLDDFRIYDRALYASEIQKIYLESNIINKSLIAHYKFNDNLDNSINNNSDINTLIEDSNYGLPTYSFDSIYDKSALFSNIRLKIPNLTLKNLTDKGDITISFWFKMDQAYTNKSWHCLFNIGDYSSNGFSMWINDNEKVYIYRYDPDSLHFGYYSINGSFTDNKWRLYTLICTFKQINSNNTLNYDFSFYENGIILTDTNNLSIINGNFIGDDSNSVYNGFIIGNVDESTNAYGTHGYFDDFRIYNKSLSKTEVENLYLDATNRGLIAHYKFDGNYNDSISTNHLVIDTGIPVYDINNEYIIANNDISFTISNPSNIIIEGQTELTISFWINKWTTLGYIMRYRPSNIVIYYDGNSVFEFTAEGHVAKYNSFSDIINWTLITIVYDNNNYKLYINNINKETISASGNFNTGFTHDTNDNIWGIFENPTGNPSFAGNLKDLKFYNRALTTLEIEKLYFDVIHNKNTNNQYTGFYKDILGNYNLKYENTEIIDNTLYLDSNYDLLETTNNFLTVNQNTSISFAVWVKRNRLNTSKDYIFSLGDAGTLTQFGAAFANISGTETNSVHFYIYNSTEINTTLQINNTTNYHYLVFVLDADNTTKYMKIYVDGNLEKEQSHTNSFSISDKKIFIGRSDGDGNIGNINIDDFKIYNKALSNIEVEKLYFEKNDRGGLIAHYKFDDDYKDNTGNNNDLVFNNTSFSSINYVYDKSIKLLKDSYLEFPSTINPYNIYYNGFGITFSYWFKLETNETDSWDEWFTIIDFSDGSGIDNNRIFISLYYPSAGDLNWRKWYFRIGDTSITFDVNKDEIDLSKFNYYVWSIDKSGNWNIYFNGILKNYGITKKIPDMTYSYRYINKMTNNYSFNGYLDDFRIYDVALSSSEVNKLYLEGSERGLIAHYKFDEVLAGNQLKDETGNYNLDYTSTNDIIDSTNGIFDSSMIKDNDADSIYTFENFPSITNTTTRTYSVWVKRNRTGSSDFIFSQGTSSSGNEIGLLFLEDNRLDLYIFNQTDLFGNTDLFANTSGTDIYYTNTSVWIHIVAVINNNNSQLYVNGVDVGSTTNTINTITGKLYIAERGTTDARINIDDFRIYNRALSAAEVEKLYNAQYIQKNQITDSTDEVIYFKYNPNIAVSGQTEYTINFPQDTECDVLVVGGGGAGGIDAGGGGGGGGVAYTSSVINMTGKYTIKVGNGGIFIDNEIYFTENGITNGKNSLITNGTDIIEVIGGGSGGYKTTSDKGNNGGSSGGGILLNRDSPGTVISAIKTGIFANINTAGGQGNIGGNDYAGGGGGASGTISSSTANGNDGIQINIDGNNYYWAGGGGGGFGGSSTISGIGGKGGGGGSGNYKNAASNTNSIKGGIGGINPGEDGEYGLSIDDDCKGGDGGKHTGGGGGGGANKVGGSGGSGIVIIRYKKTDNFLLPEIKTVNTNLIAYWKFDNNLIDEISNITITTNDTESYNDSILNKGLKTDGNNYLIDNLKLKNLVEGDSWTISFWLNISELDPSYTMMYISRYDSSSLDGLRGGFNIAIMALDEGSNAGCLRFERLYSSSSWSANYSKFSFINNLNKWIQCTIICFASGSHIYINGILENTEIHNSTWRETQRFIGTSYENQIGVGGMFRNNGYTESVYNANGYIDDLRFYNKELTSLEIYNLYKETYIDTNHIPETTYKYIIFKYDSNNDISNKTEYLINISEETECDILLVGGGGGGGTDNGGGGGAGSLVYINNIMLSGNLIVQVGKGGNGTNSQHASSTNGTDTRIYNEKYNFIANGGGHGGNGDTNLYNGGNGGSGGGSAGEADPDIAGKSINQIYIEGLYEYGNSGGTGATGGAGGGGGAGKIGNSTIDDYGAIGGDGLSGILNTEINIDFKTHFNIQDLNIGHHIDGKVYFAGGGGGANENETERNDNRGGIGGGGQGSTNDATYSGHDGKANTGGGGGGAQHLGGVGDGKAGNGGSGIVIIRYNNKNKEKSIITESIGNLISYYNFENNENKIINTNIPDMLINYKFEDDNNLGLNTSEINYSICNAIVDSVCQIDDGINGDISLKMNNGNLKIPIQILNFVSSGFTLSFWFKIPSDYGEFTYLIDMTNTTNDNKIYCGTNNGTTNDYFYIYYYKNGANYSGTYRFGDNITKDNKWHHFVWTYDSNHNWKVYFDGIYDTEPSNVNAKITDNFQEIYIGKNNSGSGSELSGNIYDIRFYNKVLLDYEIDELYNYKKTYIDEININNSNDKYIKFKYNHDDLRFEFKEDTSTHTWDEAYNKAEANGGRMPTKKELLNYLINLGYTLKSDDTKTPLYNEDIWVPVIAPEYSNGRDWIEIGVHSNVSFGTSHTEYSSYPGWGDSATTNSWERIYITVYDKYTEYFANFKEDTLCDILVVGGGGSSGGNQLKSQVQSSGGGGGGDVQYFKNITLNGNYIIKVGNGSQNYLIEHGYDSEFYKTDGSINIIACGGESGGSSHWHGDTTTALNSKESKSFISPIDGSKIITEGGGRGGARINGVGTLAPTIRANSGSGGVPTRRDHGAGGGGATGDATKYEGGKGVKVDITGLLTGYGGGGVGAEVYTTPSIDGGGCYFLKGINGRGGGAGAMTTASFVQNYGIPGGSGTVIIRLNKNIKNYEFKPIKNINNINKTEYSKVDNIYETFIFKNNNDDVDIEQYVYNIDVIEEKECDILIIGGGGAGGSDNGGGGGSGGLVFLENIVLKGKYLIKVGNGGKTNGNNKKGLNGYDSSIELISNDITIIDGENKFIAKGGGGGGGGDGNSEEYGIDGGSGGGTAFEAHAASRDIGKTNQNRYIKNGIRRGWGNDGGLGIIYSSTQGSGAGGGGVGKNGQYSFDGRYGSLGGDGLSELNGIDFKTYFNIPDNIGHHIDGKVYFGGGGGGGHNNSQTSDGTDNMGGKGGGGGGIYHANSNQDYKHGKNYTGGGGGGGSYYSGSYNYLGGVGGSGVVIIRYKSDTKNKIVLNNDLLKDGLIAYYKFDENGNNEGLLDNNEITLKHNLLKYNEIEPIYSLKSIKNKSISENIIDSRVEFPNSLTSRIYNYNTYNGITFSLWYNLKTDCPNWGALFEFSTTSTDSSETKRISINKYNNINTLWFGIKEDNIYYEVFNIGIIDNNWHHIIWSIDSNGAWTIYIDGIKQEIRNMVKLIPKTILYNYSYILDSVQTTETKGNIDEFKIYNYVLNESEINKLYFNNIKIGDNEEIMVYRYNYQNNYNDEYSEYTINFKEATICDILVVGGGGGGGRHGGGGGAGGLIYEKNIILNGINKIKVGNGGIGGNHDGTAGLNGYNSEIINNTFNKIALGGGGGGGHSHGEYYNGKDGGSGGASSGQTDGLADLTYGKQGNDSGIGMHGPYWDWGGGGGAGGKGGDAGEHMPGDGGIGLEIDITGEKIYYAGGGGGGSHYGSNSYNIPPLKQGKGGLGGGGSGGFPTGYGENGLDGLGGGGGGSSVSSGSGYGGGKGGSGIVIIKYKIYNKELNNSESNFIVDGIVNNNNKLIINNKDEYKYLELDIIETNENYKLFESLSSIKFYWANNNIIKNINKIEKLYPSNKERIKYFNNNNGSYSSSNGNYIVRHSAYNGNSNVSPEYIFSYIKNNIYWEDNNYKNGIYQGNEDLTGQNYKGDWISIELPVSIIPTKIKLVVGNLDINNKYKLPKKYRLYGKNNNLNTLIDIKTGVSDWKLVRYLPYQNKNNEMSWHKATDNLQGIEEYGDPNDMSKEWSILFGDFDEIVCGTYDLTHWVYFNKDQIITNYVDTERTVYKSSLYNYKHKIKWNNREDNTGGNIGEDPWISIKNHADNYEPHSPNLMVYGENSFSGHSSLLSDYGGMAVWVRNSKKNWNLILDEKIDLDNDLNKSYNINILIDIKTEVSGWRLVRYLVDNSSNWHQSTDNLQGTEVYGTAYDMNNNWSILFGEYDELCVGTYDLTHWVYFNKDQISTNYSNLSRTVYKSSVNSQQHTSKWYNRSTNAEDPWISVRDHADTIIYGENSTTDHTSLLSGYGGLAVWVRKSNNNIISNNIENIAYEKKIIRSISNNISYNTFGLIVSEIHESSNVDSELSISNFEIYGLEKYINNNDNFIKFDVSVETNYNNIYNYGEIELNENNIEILIDNNNIVSHNNFKLYNNLSEERLYPSHFVRTIINSNNFEITDKIYGNGYYEISWSSESSDTTKSPLNVFIKNNEESIWENNKYSTIENSVVSLYNGDKYIVEDYKGEWIKIKLPYEILLTKIILVLSNSSINDVNNSEVIKNFPYDFNIYGSNDNENWELIKNFYITEFSLNNVYNNNNGNISAYEVEVSNKLTKSKLFSNYGLVVSKIGGGLQLNISSWDIYGKEQKQQLLSRPTAIPTEENVKFSDLIKVFRKDIDFNLNSYKNLNFKFSDFYTSSSIVSKNIANSKIPNDGKISLSNFKGSSGLTTILPFENEVYAHYANDVSTLEFDNNNNIIRWNDKSNNNRDITEYRGTPKLENILGNSNGLNSTNINVIYGDENSGFRMPFTLPVNYTFCYIARYVGDNNNTTYNKRIFDSRTGNGENTLWGFHNNSVGVSHSGERGWHTKPSPYTIQSDSNNWIIGIETKNTSRFNGMDCTNYYTNSSGTNYPLDISDSFNPILTINYGHYTSEYYNTEISRWQIGEIIFYDRELNLDEKKSVENYLAINFGHISFKSVISSYNEFININQNIFYDNWFMIYDNYLYGYGNNIIHGPAPYKFQFINSSNYYYWFWYATGNNHDILLPPYLNDLSYYVNSVVLGGGGGGGGNNTGSAGGAGGQSFIVNKKLENINFSFSIGGGGVSGQYYAHLGRQSTSGINSTLIIDDNYLLTAYGGGRGAHGTRSGPGAGGIFIGGDSGENGGDGQTYGCGGACGGAIGTILQNINLKSTQSFWDVLQDAPITWMSYNSGYWWANNPGAGGMGARGGFSGDQYARDGGSGGSGAGVILLDYTIPTVPDIDTIEWIYTESGFYTWTCPENITNISVVAVGGGGGGGNSTSYGASGGGGGGLIWVNNITVIPNTDYLITVGAGGQGSTNGTSNGEDGGDTDFNDLLIAQGGKGGQSSGASNTNLTGGNGGHRSINIPGNTTYGGGTGGNGGTNSGDWCGGGGGAGGYTGNGGNGNINAYHDNGQDGQGGGGGGGAVFDGAGNSAPGGGVGIYGQGINGLGGTGGHSNGFTASAGKSGSDGIDAINENDPDNDSATISTAGKYGGGGGGFSGTSYGHSNGANGALRIIYNPEALFPNLFTSVLNYNITYTNENKLQILCTQWIYNIAGNYIWTCPDGITQISVVAVGGGGSGGNRSNSDQYIGSSGGGGGGLIWVNNITVVPGNNYIIEVGHGGQGSTDGIGHDGGDTKFIDNGNELFKANGGKGGGITSVDTSGGNGGQRSINISGHTDYGGGNGGDGGPEWSGHSGGGGGAGGYTGNGGNGNYGWDKNGFDGQGGGGGGGTNYNNKSLAAPGGGVGIYGQGINGAAGVLVGSSQRSPVLFNSLDLQNYEIAKGKSGSGGIEAIYENDSAIISTAGKYGGGGGGYNSNWNAYSYGSNGALRIIYHPKALFPTTKVSNSDYPLTYTNQNATSTTI